ncbi:sugar phosphate isomerase/epimerase [Pseudomonas syringae USA007]|uniref:Sugar phosphate isomerase/epimerase n=1 Tax=Pseudomonas syringae USA007 TaxID=1357288 RepID=A0AAU8M386_PSESX|nr:sugar phosphate isomerase/epimerase [Pseudomonas syringae]
MKVLKEAALTIALAICASGGAAIAAAPAATSPIALQMYTLRNVGTLDQQLALAERTGFTAVELVGTQGVSSAELNILLSKHHLTVTSAHVQLDVLRHQLPEAIAFNRAVGNTVLVVPYLQPDEWPTDAAGWQKLGKELDALGAQLRRDGMKLAYHNHDFEMKAYGSKTAYEWLVDSTQPKHLLLEIDAAWVSRGGQDPERLIKRYADRLFALHAKDNAGTGVRDDEANFAPLGEGLLAWPQIIAAAQKTGKPLYIVEHDLPKDPAAIITVAKDNLQRDLNGSRQKD